MKRLAFLLCLLAFPVSAQECASFDAMRMFLAKNYDEHPTRVGRIPLEPNFVVLFESATGTASFVTVNGEGIACLAAGVGAWKAWPEGPPWRDL